MPILAPLARLYHSLFTDNIINLSTNAYIIAQYKHDIRCPCTLCNTEPANLTGPDMPANNVTRRRNAIARQDRLEHEARTQALARHEVGLTGHDHRHNIASGSHGPRYHQGGRTPNLYATAYRRSSSPVPRVRYPYTRTASNCRPCSPSPSPWGDPEGQAACQCEMEEQWLLPLGRGPPPQSQRELTDAEYDQLWDNNHPQPAAGDSTEAGKALLGLAAPPSSTLVGPPSRVPSAAYDPASPIHVPTPIIDVRTPKPEPAMPRRPPTPTPAAFIEAETPFPSIQPPRHNSPEIQEISEEEYITVFVDVQGWAIMGIDLVAAGLTESHRFHALRHNRCAYANMPEEGKIEFTDMLLTDLADLSFRRTEDRACAARDRREAHECIVALEDQVAVLMQILKCIKAEVTCAICMDIAKDVSTLPCGHTFCRECITQSHAYGVTHYDWYGRLMVSDRQPCPTWLRPTGG